VNRLLYQLSYKAFDGDDWTRTNDPLGEKSELFAVNVLLQMSVFCFFKSKLNAKKFAV
jgi:hypothetical protein